jgi:Na+-transporting methylmalonyl-CoA/oxaloacetate decarboxylase gamma subunit
MDNVLMGLSTTGLGMLVVFLGLIFLMYIMIGLAGISKTGGKKPSAKAEKLNDVAVPMAAEAVEKAVPSVVESPAATLKHSTADEEIAAIAAVMAILTSEGVHGAVTAVRPLGPKLNLWALAGRRDIMASRL